MPRKPQPRVQPPRDLGSGAALQSFEPRPVQRLGCRWQSCSGFERRLLADGGGGADGIAQPLQLGGRLCEQPSRGRGVPSRLRDLAERQACQRGSTLVPGRDLGAQCLLEERPGLGVRIVSEQQLALPLARFGCALLISRLGVEQLRATIQLAGLGEIVQLYRQVRPSECDARAHRRRRPGRIRQTLRATQSVERSLQLTCRRERTGELAPYRERVGEGSGPVINRQCVAQRGPGRRIVAAAQLQLTEPVQRVRDVGPLLAGAPGRQGVAVQPFGVRELSGSRGQRGEVHQVGRRDLVAPISPVDLECCLELAARLVRIPDGLRQQPQIVVIRRHPPRIPDPLAQGEGLRVARARRGQIALIRAGAGESPEGVGLDANVPDARGECARPLEIRAGAVEPTLTQKGGADVAQHRGDTGRIGDRPGAPEGAAPDRNRRSGSGPAIRRDTRATHAVGPDFRRAPLGRPCLEPRHLAHQERIAPCLRVGGRQTARCAEIVAREGIRDGVADRQWVRAGLEDESRLGDAQRQQPQ